MKPAVHTNSKQANHLMFMGPCIIIIFQYINPQKMHMLQSLFYLTIALHVSGVTITHLQEHKTTVTTASGNLNTCYSIRQILPLFFILSRINPIQAIQSYFLRSILILSKRSVYFLVYTTKLCAFLLFLTFHLPFFYYQLICIWRGTQMTA
jgi:hypothetical protein